MSKRRQTISSISVTQTKKSKLDDSPSEEEEVDSTPVSELTDKQIRQCLLTFGETPGPIMQSTRVFYERQLEKYRSNEIQPKESTPPKPCNQSTPARPSRVSFKTESKSTKNKGKSTPIAEDRSPENLSLSPLPVKIESLPEPPSSAKADPFMITKKTKRTPMKPQDQPTQLETLRNCIVEKLSNKQIRDHLVAEGENPGPINNMNRKLYEELLEMYKRGDKTGKQVTLSESSAARKLSTLNESPAFSSTRIGEEIKRSRNRDNGADNYHETITEEQNVLQDYPEDDMEVEPSMCVSYAKSPYKKTRRSICKVEFTDTDFVVISSSSSPSSRPSYYHDLQKRGVQALVAQDASSISLVNAVKSAKGSVKIYAGVTVASIKEGRLATSNALQCGSDAVVIAFSKYECSDAIAIASSIKQIMEGHMTASYFYYHNPSTTACPIKISKELLTHGNGFQGVFASPDSEEKLLLLESLGIKIYETDSTKILRSLAHGIDAFASFEGIIAMPVICKLKEEYYEGNTSESCRLQLILCRLVRALTKHGDLLPSIHSSLKYLGREAGELPLPLQPLPNEVPLLKDLADLNVDKW